MAMTSGKADPMKLYIGGKLKISGDLMASQKLSFLKKIDPAQALAAIQKKRGAGGGAPAAGAAPAAAPGEMGSAEVFTAIEDHIERNADIVGRVGKTFVFKLTSPDSAWTLDVKNGKGSVQTGAVDKADCTLELADADFLAMTSGKADPMKLYMGGKLKISGNVMARRSSSSSRRSTRSRPSRRCEEARRRAGGSSCGCGGGSRRQGRAEGAAPS